MRLSQPHTARRTRHAAENRAGIERYEYTPYGEQTVMDASYSVKTGGSDYGQYKGFTGQTLDPESGLWYFRKRYYHAGLGTFTSVDQLEYLDGMNLRAGYFAMYGYLDPSGFSLWWDFIGVFVRRAARKTNPLIRFTIGSDWIWGEDYDVTDDDDEIMATENGQNRSWEYVVYVARELKEDDKITERWQEFDVIPMDDTTDVGGNAWTFPGGAGSGGFFLGTAHNVEVVGGTFEARCDEAGRIHIRNRDIEYLWHDRIDANSWWEQKDNWEQGFDGKIIKAIEGWFDLWGDKIQDLDYDTHVTFFDRTEESRAFR